jgi:hypothetical protein
MTDAAVNPVTQVFFAVVDGDGHMRAGRRVLADRSEDELARRVGLTVWERLVADRQDAGVARFLDTHLSPSLWTSMDTIRQWLADVETDVPGVDVSLGQVPIESDDYPGHDHDLTIGFMTGVGGNRVVAGLSQHVVERDVAVMVLDHINATPAISSPRWLPVLDDPGSVLEWLEYVRRDMTGVATQVHQVVLPARSVQPMPDWASPVQVTLPSHSDVGPVKDPGSQLWVGAVFWDGDAHSDPDLVADTSRSGVRSQLAEWIYDELGNNLSDASAQRLIQEHTPVPDWADSAQVDDWLSDVATSGVGVKVGVDLLEGVDIPGSRWLSVATLIESDPSEAWFMAGVDEDMLRCDVVEWLTDQLDDPTVSGGQKFLAEYGRPYRDLDQVEAWLDAYHTRFQHRTPAIHFGEVMLPVPVAGSASGVETVTQEAVSGEATETRQVGRVTWLDQYLTDGLGDSADAPVRVVGVQDLWSGVLVSPDLGIDNPQVWVGTHDQMVYAMALLIHQGLVDQPDDQYLAEHQLDWSTQETVESWLDTYMQITGDPQVFIRNVYDAGNGQNLPLFPVGVQPGVRANQLRVAIGQPLDPPVAVEADPAMSSQPPTVVAGVIRWDEESAPSVVLGTDVAGVRREVAGLLAGQGRGGRFDDDVAEFLATHGHPAGLDDTQLQAWLGAFHEAVMVPEAFVRSGVLLPLSVGEGAVGLGLAEPVRGEVVVGVVRWGDGFGWAETVVGQSVDEVLRGVAGRVWADLQTPLLDPADELARLGDPAGLPIEEIRVWLDQVDSIASSPEVDIHEHVSTEWLKKTTDTALSKALRDPAPKSQAGEGQVVIDTERAADWAVLNEGGIPDMLINAFPPLPADPNDDELTQEWMDECLDLAVKVSGLLERLDRLDTLEYLHDRLTRHLAGHSLPPEPQTADFRSSRGGFAGEFDDVAYRWQHRQWQRDFNTAARETQRFVAKLIRTTAPQQGAPEPSRIESVTSNDVRERPQVMVSVGFAVDGRTIPLTGGFPFTQPQQSGSGGLSLG